MLKRVDLPSFSRWLFNWGEKKEEEERIQLFYSINEHKSYVKTKEKRKIRMNREGLGRSSIGS